MLTCSWIYINLAAAGHLEYQCPGRALRRFEMLHIGLVNLRQAASGEQSLTIKQQMGSG